MTTQMTVRQASPDALMLSNALQMSDLDESQKAFCANPAQAVRLLAPAGSGKTYSLLWRCLNFSEISDEDQRFLIFTFTKAARDELRDRLKTDSMFQLIREKTEISTLNAWGFRRLKSKKYGLRICTSSADKYFCVNNLLQPVWLKYPRMKTVLESSKAKGRTYKGVIDLIDYLKTLGFRHDRYEGLKSLIEHLKWLFENKMQAHVHSIFTRLQEHEIIDTNNTSFEKTLEQINEHFMGFWRDACQHLYETSFITLEDQKYWTLIDIETLLTQGKSTTGMHRFHHVLVDEFQDINTLDLNLLKAIAQFNKTNLTIIGDDDQAIYEWRGASPYFILNPDHSIAPGYKSHILEVNYRSPKNIVAYSQRLIKHNKNRVDKNIVAKSKTEAKIIVRQMLKLTDSTNYVLETVRKSLNNPEIKKVGIIGRKRSQIIPYQIIFASEGIPFYAAEDLQVFLSGAFRELKEMLAIKARVDVDGKYVSDPIGDLLKLCDKVKRYPLSKKDSQELRKFLYSVNPTNLMKALETLCHYGGTLKGSNNQSKMSIKFAEAIANFLQAKTVSEAIDAISDNFDGLQKDYGKSLDDIFYADPPFLHMSEYSEQYGDNYQAFSKDIEKAISTLAKIPSEDDSSQSGDSWKLPLHLMTAQRAKGKEFDVVIILDANKDIWPIKLAVTEEQLEQERRLFYVAFTRTKKQVIILVNETMLDEKALPSPYLDEMGLQIQV